MNTLPKQGCIYSSVSYHTSLPGPQLSGVSVAPT